MGWWSAAIMGGDSPLDYFGGICALAVPGKYRGGNPEVLTRKALNEALPAIRGWLAKKNQSYPADMSVSLQALGVTIMERGADMPDDLRAEIIAAADADEWAREDGTRSERGQNIAAFIEKVKAYKPGKRVDCKREEGLLSRGGGTSLFENMEKVLSGRSS